MNRTQYFQSNANNINCTLNCIAKITNNDKIMILIYYRMKRKIGILPNE